MDEAILLFAGDAENGGLSRYQRMNDVFSNAAECKDGPVCSNCTLSQTFSLTFECK